MKAAFLLLVFSLNTLVGFACAMGIDVGFNTGHHHEDEEVTEIHEHAGSKMHHHHEDQESRHSHKNGPDDCCHDKVVKISQADKSIPPVLKIFNPVFFTAFIAVFQSVDVSYSSQVNISNKYFVLGHHPPIADIRIAIHSFLI